MRSCRFHLQAGWPATNGTSGSSLKRAPRRVTGSPFPSVCCRAGATVFGIGCHGTWGRQRPVLISFLGFSRCRTRPAIRQTCPPHQPGDGRAQRQPGLVVDGRTSGDRIGPAPRLGRFPARRISVSAGLSHPENGSETAKPSRPPSGRHVCRRRRFGQLFSLRRTGTSQAGTGPDDLWAGPASRAIRKEPACWMG